MLPFTFNKDRCLNCDSKLPVDWKGLFCSSCEVSLGQIKKGGAVIYHFMTIDELDLGETGYIKPGYIYFQDGTMQVRVLANAIIKKERDGAFSLRVRRGSELILVDATGLDEKFFRSLISIKGSVESYEVFFTNDFN